MRRGLEDFVENQKVTGAIETEPSDLLIKDGTRIEEKQGEQEAKA